MKGLKLILSLFILFIFGFSQNPLYSAIEFNSINSESSLEITCLKIQPKHHFISQASSSENKTRNFFLFTPETDLEEEIKEDSSSKKNSFSKKVTSTFSYNQSLSFLVKQNSVLLSNYTNTKNTSFSALYLIFGSIRL
ncbi:MAG: hypothetical protein ACJAZ3_001405 [Sphingobacteriales bacterium]|jgi:hypothetical protein